MHLNINNSEYFYCSLCNFFCCESWVKKSPLHEHILLLDEAVRKLSKGWICDRCSKNFEMKKNSFYCSQCDFVDIKII